MSEKETHWRKLMDYATGWSWWRCERCRENLEVPPEQDPNDAGTACEGCREKEDS